MGWSRARQMHVMLDMKMQILFFFQTSSWIHWTLHGLGTIWYNPLLLTSHNFFLTCSPLLLFSRHAGPVALSPTLQARVCPRIYEPAVVSIWTVLANIYMAHSLISFIPWLTPSFLSYLSSNTTFILWIFPTDPVLPILLSHFILLYCQLTYPLFSLSIPLFSVTQTST